MKNKINILAFDLQNAKVENLISWLDSFEYDFSSEFKNQLIEIVKNNDTIENKIIQIYTVNSTIIGTSDENNFPSIILNDHLILDILKLVSISVKEIKPYAKSLVDLLSDNPEKNRELSFSLLNLQEYDEDDQYQFPNFIECISSIDIESLGMKFKELFNPLVTKFKRIYSYFKQKYPDKTRLDSLKISKIYYLGKYVLGHTLKVDDTDEEKFFWSINLEEHLQMIDKYAFDEEIQYDLNMILDKILISGIESLNTNELEFLDSQ